MNCETLESRRLLASDMGLVSPMSVAEPASNVTREIGVYRPHANTLAIQSKAAQAAFPLAAAFSTTEIRENSRGVVTLTLRRNPRDVSSDLLVRVTGGDSSQLPLSSIVVIPAGLPEVTIRLTPTNDSIAEKTADLNYTFTASGYQPAMASIRLLDDETPTHQNPISRFDVNDDGKTTPADILVVINKLALAGNSELDPAARADPFFYDVSGDYQVTPLDILLVINALSENPESQASSTPVVDSDNQDRSFDLKINNSNPIAGIKNDDPIIVTSSINRSTFG
jgi:hypothetical protein